MPVLTRRINALSIGGLTCIGGVQDADRTLIAIPTCVAPEDVHRALPMPPASLTRIGGGLLATLPADCALDVQPAETDLLSGLNVLVSVRNAQTAEAAATWLDYHTRTHKAEAALIFDRDPEPGAHFARDLANLDPKLPVLVVSSDRPLGADAAPDARDPALAPASPKREIPAPDPWHAALAELSLFELLRRRFLANSRAVAFLDIADLMLPGPDSVFDRAAACRGAALPLHGVETYPWRLRQNRPAPHGDHIATRRHEPRMLLSWAAAPAELPDEAIWQPGRPLGAPWSTAEPVHFRRAIGIVFPGSPVSALVNKRDLREDPDLVALMRDAFGSEPIRLPTPQTIPPRANTQNVTIVTAMKNEGPFILDWIAHNRAIGIQNHLVYTNDCADGTDHLLDLLKDAEVTRRDNPYLTTGKVPQHAAFRAAEAEAAVQQADWLLTLDVDEYIDIHTGQGRIADLLSASPEAHVISLPWRLFGNNDRHRFSDEPVTEQFTRCAPEYAPRPIQAWAFKTLYRNAGLFRRLGVHRPRGIEPEFQDQIVWVGGTGAPMPEPVWRAAWRFGKGTWGYDLATVNHYAVRSAESFLVKRDRGRVNHTTREQGAAYWRDMNHNAEENTSILRLRRRVADEKAALLAIPGVSEAHRQSVDWHRKRIVALRNSPAYAQLYTAITGSDFEAFSRVATRDPAPT